VVRRPLKPTAKVATRGAARAGRNGARRNGVAAPARPVTPDQRDASRAAALLAARASLPTPPDHGLLSRGFTLCTLNCCGLRSAERRGFLRWLRRARPDVLCLQEVRAWPEQVPADVRCPAGYNTRWLNCGRKGYSGVATYSRASPDRYLAGSGLSWGDEEARVLRAEFGDLVVINLYLPSGSSSPERQILKFEYLEHLLDVTAGWLAEDRPTALCGDWNIAHTELDIHAPRANSRNSGFLPSERAWFTRLLEQGWVDVLRRLHPESPGLYSWWSNRGAARQKDRGWRIDYVLANPLLAKHAKEAWIEKRAGLSDHAPVWVRFA